jgi:hypothetical protein
MPRKKGISDAFGLGPSYGTGSRSFSCDITSMVINGL